MVNTSSIQLSIGVVGSGLADTYASATQNPIINAAAPGAVPTAVSLGAGNTTVNFPPGTQTLVIYPAVTPNTNAKTVGGLAIHPALPFLWSPPVGTTSVVINAVAPEVVLIAFC